MTTIVLPIPPSANKLWRVHRGRAIKSREYRAWLEEASLVVLMARAKAVPPPVRVVLTLRGGKGFNRARDGDNLFKPTLDLLRHAHIISGDTVIEVPDLELHYTEGDKGDDATFTVTVSSADSPTTREHEQ